LGDNREMKSETKFKQTEIGLIPEDWEIIKGEDCLTLEIGSRPKGGVSDVGEIPSLGGEHIDLVSHRVDFQKSPKYISREYFNQMQKGKLKINDILINKDGAYAGKLAFVWELFSLETAINEHLFIIRSNGQVDQKFIFYYLLSKEGEHQIKQNVTGSAQPGLNSQFIKRIMLPKPNLSEQLQISEVLSRLDFKINIIQKQNKTLEAIGQAIFKHWFVDFEFPNEEGKPYKSSGGEMVDNGELGKEIPKGWEVEGLLNFFSVIYGKNISTKDIMLNGKFPVFGGNGIIGYLNDYEYKEPVTLISCRGAASGKIIITSPFSTVTHNSLVLLPKNERLNSYFMFNLLKMMNIIQFVTGSAQPQITIENLRSLKIIIPSNETLDKINPLIKCLFLSRFQNETQIQTLSQLRDLLLPKLMSGKIRVPTGGD